MLFKKTARVLNAAPGGAKREKIPIIKCQNGFVTRITWFFSGIQVFARLCFFLFFTKIIFEGESAFCLSWISKRSVFWMSS